MKYDTCAIILMVIGIFYVVRNAFYFVREIIASILKVIVIKRTQYILVRLFKPDFETNICEFIERNNNTIVIDMGNYHIYEQGLYYIPVKKKGKNWIWTGEFIDIIKVNDSNCSVMTTTGNGNVGYGFNTNKD